MLLLCGVLSGCGTLLERLPGLPESAQEAPATIEQIEIVPRSVAILLSSNTPGYAEIAEALRGLLDGQPHEIFNLNGDVSTAGAVVRRIHASKHNRVVAVGLLAAQAVRPLRDK